MRRFATPTIRFRLRAQKEEYIDTILGGTCYLTFGKVNPTTGAFTELFDTDFEVENVNGQTYIKTTLTQEQTSMYEQNTDAQVQFRAMCGKTSVVSSIAPVRVLPAIKQEVL